MCKRKGCLFGTISTLFTIGSWYNIPNSYTHWGKGCGVVKVDDDGSGEERSPKAFPYTLKQSVSRGEDALLSVQSVCSGDD